MTLNHRLIIISLILGLSVLPMFSSVGISDDKIVAPPEIPDEVTPLKTSIYRGYNWTVDEFGEPMIRFYLNPITVFPPLRFKNKKE